MDNSKYRFGQAASEYLIIFAAVLLVAMVVVSILSGASDFSSGAKERDSESYWLSANPISILDSAQYSSGDGKSLSLTIQNRAPSYITVYGFNLSSPSGSTSNQSSLYLMPGQKISMNFISHSSCSGRSGQYVEYEVSLFYDQEPITRKIQVGEKPLLVKCS